MSVESKHYLNNDVEWDPEMTDQQKKEVIEMVSPLLDGFHNKMMKIKIRDKKRVIPLKKEKNESK